MTRPAAARHDHCNLPTMSAVRLQPWTFAPTTPAPSEVVDIAVSRVARRENKTTPAKSPTVARAPQRFSATGYGRPSPRRPGPYTKWGFLVCHRKWDYLAPSASAAFAEPIRGRPAWSSVTNSSSASHRLAHLCAPSVHRKRLSFPWLTTGPHEGVLRPMMADCLPRSTAYEAPTTRRPAAAQETMASGTAHRTSASPSQNCLSLTLFDELHRGVPTTRRPRRQSGDRKRGNAIASPARIMPLASGERCQQHPQIHPRVRKMGR